MGRRLKGNAAFVMSIIRLYIKYPLQSLGVTLLIVILLNLFNHQEFIEPILFSIIFGGCLLLLSYIAYYYFIKKHDNHSKKNKNTNRNRAVVNRSYKITYPESTVKICQACGKEFVPVKDGYDLCFSCRKDIIGK